MPRRASRVPTGRNRGATRNRRPKKRTNEIGTSIPLPDTMPAISGKILMADALPTQRTLARYLKGRGAGGSKLPSARTCSRYGVP